ncbi:topoisomerase DNA-binding C4 zinc finger domain-containing protein [Pseudomonas viridiflava]|uniref:topoisomerase DNA-binding C4 zinc finger domain-containing protein n=1 Tax=Pseudomonas viridiflava TaxID=33069 RepID=UPI00083F6853|nr:topoisomerase DNA-binding C4 zinc finger domain-containing protein [Pseudomonas viridiflava]MBI6681662.1 topoisomerase DNA-binding C4 zinc finger domain-containing protein [Pseudomonas viridiflava]MCJ8176885.1 topoisomerase DNA-binding C4 zinc finger domain-containing protein [Pseudomonas viridiflava]MEE3925878.1 topoisomerase DNA-binding C4 zinc finger domain-containing protein [Pseudomonas viridiflava]MEE3932412.1 topoisomerase DNA-binding C4 zinc finger domain-containing protein [Pseudomo
MARKTQPPLQAFIGAIRRLVKAAAATISRRKPDADNEKRDVSVVEAAPLGVSEQAVDTKARPRKRKSRPTTPKPETKPATPNCPHCKKPMVIKVARTGKNAGDFWGCVAYPKCRGIRPIFRKE